MKWTLLDLNQRPSDYESDALTIWAKGPMQGKNDAMRFIQTIKNQLDIENKNFRAAKIKNKEKQRTKSS